MIQYYNFISLLDLLAIREVFLSCVGIDLIILGCKLCSTFLKILLIFFQCRKISFLNVRNVIFCFGVRRQEEVMHTELFAARKVTCSMK